MKEVEFTTQRPRTICVILGEHPNCWPQLLNDVHHHVQIFSSQARTQSLPNRILARCQTHSWDRTHPRGNFALTSTRPYRILFFPFVERRALITGLIIVPAVLLLTALHAVRFVFVQPVKLKV